MRDCFEKTVFHAKTRFLTSKNAKKSQREMRNCSKSNPEKSFFVGGAYPCLSIHFPIFELRSSIHFAKMPLKISKQYSFAIETTPGCDDADQSAKQSGKKRGLPRRNPIPYTVGMHSTQIGA